MARQTGLHPDLYWLSCWHGQQLAVPAHISAYGGATLLIPYLIFVVIIASTGGIG